MRSTDRRFFVCGAAASLTYVGLRSRGGLAAPNLCPVSAEQEEGPFYLEDRLVRGDISENKAGVPLWLQIKIIDAATCAPLTGVAVDLWHCDAAGLYSGFTTAMLGPGGPAGLPHDPDTGGQLPGRPPAGLPLGGHPPVGHPPTRHQGGPRPQGGPPPNGQGGPPLIHPTDKLTFLRGIQLTDAKGGVAFQTIFPGWYQGRTEHIHFKLRSAGKNAVGFPTAGHTSHTGQLFFDEALTALIAKLPQYRQHQGEHLTHADDEIFSQQHGSAFVMTTKLTMAGAKVASVNGSITIAIDPAATSAPPGRGG